HQHNGAARGANIDRLLPGVQHQHGGVQRMAAVVTMGCVAVYFEHRRDGPVAPQHRAVHRIVPLPCHTFATANSLCRAYPVSGVKSGLLTSSLCVRATVGTNNLDAPARPKTRGHSEAVVPVVNTSSTKRISRPSIASGRDT